jgi:hypothetical protein
VHFIGLNGCYIWSGFEFNARNILIMVVVDVVTNV